MPCSKKTYGIKEDRYQCPVQRRHMIYENKLGGTANKHTNLMRLLCNITPILREAINVEVTTSCLTFRWEMIHRVKKKHMPLPGPGTLQDFKHNTGSRPQVHTCTHWDREDYYANIRILAQTLTCSDAIRCHQTIAAEPLFAPDDVVDVVGTAMNCMDNTTRASNRVVRVVSPYQSKWRVGRNAVAGNALVYLRQVVTSQTLKYLKNVFKNSIVNIINILHQ